MHLTKKKGQTTTVGLRRRRRRTGREGGIEYCNTRATWVYLVLLGSQGDSFRIRTTSQPPAWPPSFHPASRRSPVCGAAYSGRHTTPNPSEQEPSTCARVFAAPPCSTTIRRPSLSPTCARAAQTGKYRTRGSWRGWRILTIGRQEARVHRKRRNPAVRCIVCCSALTLAHVSRIYPADSRRLKRRR